MPRIKLGPDEPKPAINVQVHMDVRVLASLFVTLRKFGARTPPKLSTLVNDALDVLWRTMKDNKVLTEVTSIHEAVQILETAGFQMSQVYKRSPAITAGLAWENRAVEGLRPSQMQPPQMYSMPPEALEAIEKERERKRLEALQAPEVVFEGQMPAPAPTREEELEALRRMREKLGLAAPPSDTQ